MRKIQPQVILRRLIVVAGLYALSLFTPSRAGAAATNETSFLNSIRITNSIYLRVYTDTNAVRKLASITNGITVLTDTSNVPKLWFPVGEIMDYDIYWGLLHVGSTHVVTEWVQKDGKTLLRIRHITKSNRAIATVYPVDDRLETLIDPDGFLPIYFRKTQSEGHYRSDEITVFDRSTLVATHGSYRSGNLHEFRIAHDTRDLVTMMYWLRGQPFLPVTKTDCRVMADQKIYDLTLRVGAVETRRVGDYGKVKVVRIDPEAAFNGLFVRKGKMTVWVSDDDRRLCTHIDAEVPVASIHLELDKVTGPGNDKWVGKK